MLTLINLTITLATTTAATTVVVTATIALLTLAALAAVCGWWWHRRHRRGGRHWGGEPLSLMQAVQLFEQARPHLGESLRQAAARLGKPRGLLWESCELGERVTFASATAERGLLALTEVTVRFSAVPGGEMEEVAVVAEPRHATAVFICIDSEWTTEGRVLFNLTPAEAIARLGLVVQVITAANGSD